MHRISPFNSKAGFVAWLFLLEAVLAYLHLGEFIIHLAEGLYRFAETHFFWDLGIGLGLLLLLNQWPTIEPRIPSWLRLKTVHERLHALEDERLPAVMQHHDATASRVTDFEKWMPEIDSKLGENVARLESLERNSRESLNRLDHVYSALTELPTLQRYLFQLNCLVYDIERSVETFRTIRAMYGDLSPVVTKPFSNWRLPSHSIALPADDSIRDGEKWARSLESYIERAQGFRNGWYGDYFLDDGLFSLVAHWYTNYNETSADELEKIMLVHRQFLIDMRQDYASRFIGDKLKGKAS